MVSDVSIPGVNIAAALARMDNNEETYIQVLRAYLKQTPEFIERARKEAESDLKEYRVAVHGIKGSSHGIGADETGEKALELEKAAEQGNEDFIRTNNSLFLESVEKLISNIDNFIRTMDAHNSDLKKENKMEKKQSTIIYVDDDSISLDVGREILDKLYKIHLLSSGEELFELLQLIRPDLILLDVKMPGMTGYEVIKKLKGNPATENIPVIFITSYNDHDNELEGLALGAIDYLSKPFSPPILMKRIENHLLLATQREQLKIYSQRLEKLVNTQTNEIVLLQNELVDLVNETRGKKYTYSGQ